MIPEESRWVCMECGHIFYGVDVAYCDDCGSYDIEEMEDYESDDNS
jgi:uncharacterized OB-fold protein